MIRKRNARPTGAAVMLGFAVLAGGCDWEDFVKPRPKPPEPPAAPETSDFLRFRAPAGDLPTMRSTTIDGKEGAVLTNGRFVTPVGIEISVEAPKPFGLAVSPDGKTVAAINSGASKFSVTLIRDLAAAKPVAQRVDIDATFMGVQFSADGKHFYASGGENGNLWIGDAATGIVVGSINLNGADRPLDRPLAVKTRPAKAFKGAFPGNMALTKDGRYLYVVDQGSFSVYVIDTTKAATGVDAEGKIVEPDNFAAVVNKVKAGRYPFGIALSPDDKRLYVANVGTFQYSHLQPAAPTGDASKDYPLCIPGAGYPQETEASRTIKIKKVNGQKMSTLPATFRDPEGIRCGYVDADREYVVPGVGSPNVPEAASVYAMDVVDPVQPRLIKPIKTGRLVGEVDDGLETYATSHPNAIAVGSKRIYVVNGNNDSVSVIDPQSHAVIGEISLTFLGGLDARLRGIQPMAAVLSPDQRTLYVAEPGLNAISVVALDPDKSAKADKHGKVVGRIPTAWFPSSVKLSADGKTLFVANARGRGAGPSRVSESVDHPKHSTLGNVQIIPVPDHGTLREWTKRVYANNGFVEGPAPKSDGNPIPSKPGVQSQQIKHVIFINKENLTHDQIFGHLTKTRKGVPVESDPTLALDEDAAPNHYELARRFSINDNFFLEPTVSSDGHRWLTNTYTTEFEETHWPASYGGRRRDSGDDPASFKNWPGRIGFTDANASPEPNDYNQFGGIYLHLHRHGKTFANFGNGFEFALIDEPGGVEPTGNRQHANVPMEKVVRDNTDHMYPTYNTHIPDAPLPQDPDRFNRYARFEQMFKAHFIDQKTGACKLPAYVDLYYPNDHGGGANDIGGPGGTGWDFKRFVQDNDLALGLTIELLSKSSCWKDTVVFVTEDDTQAGLDHVDGQRAPFLVISPWAKKEHVSKTHASLASLFKTIHLILGTSPLNLYDAAATDLRDMFTSKPDFTPYEHKAISYEVKTSALWAKLTAGVDFDSPDAEEVNLREAILRSEGIPRKAIQAAVKAGFVEKARAAK